MVQALSKVPKDVVVKSHSITQDDPAKLSCYLEVEGDDAECEEEIYLDDVDDSMLDEVVIGRTLMFVLIFKYFLTCS